MPKMAWKIRFVFVIFGIRLLGRPCCYIYMTICQIYCRTLHRKDRNLSVLEFKGTCRVYPEKCFTFFQLTRFPRLNLLSMTFWHAFIKEENGLKMNLRHFSKNILPGHYQHVKIGLNYKIYRVRRSRYMLVMDLGIINQKHNNVLNGSPKSRVV